VPVRKGDAPGGRGAGSWRQRGVVSFARMPSL
jgi:hypothetical protein